MVTDGIVMVGEREISLHRRERHRDHTD
jgi:hypothetical protein